VSGTREALPRSSRSAGAGLLALVGILMVGVPLGLGVLVAIFLAREDPGAALAWSLAATAVAFMAGTVACLYIAIGRAVAMLDEIEFNTREAAAHAREAAERAHQLAAAPAAATPVQAPDKRPV